MMARGSSWLMTAGGLSIAAALLHLGCLVGGAPWFRALGAGEGVVRAAERGELFPVIGTIFIAAVLFGWAAYAFSAAGILMKLPLTRTALVAISSVLLLRGLAVPAMQAWRPDLSQSFIYTTAAICTIYGLIFLIGTIKAWPVLSAKGAI
jgi:hypothetical protein